SQYESDAYLKEILTQWKLYFSNLMTDSIKDALSALEEAKRLAFRNKDSLELARAQFQIGRQHARFYDQTKGLVSLNEAYTLYMALNDSFHVLKTGVDLIRAYLDINYYDKANSVYEELKEFKVYGDIELKAVASMIFVSYYQFDKAIDLMTQCYQKDSIDNNGSIVYDLYCLSLFYINKFIHKGKNPVDLKKATLYKEQLRTISPIHRPDFLESFQWFWIDSYIDIYNSNSKRKVSKIVNKINELPRGKMDLASELYVMDLLIAAAEVKEDYKWGFSLQKEKDSLNIKVENQINKEKALFMEAMLLHQRQLNQSNQELLEADHEIKVQQIWIFSIGVILISMLFGFIQSYKNARIRRTQAEMQEKLLRMELREKEQELEQKQKELVSRAIIDQEKLQVLKSGLDKIVLDQHQKNALLEKLNNDFNDHSWEAFRLKFNEVQPSFLDNLSERHNNLTEYETRLASYLRLGLKSDEISRVLNIGKDSVRMAKYRLKKKLDIEDQYDLEDYIKQV
ncbi:MAG: hypothetical protein MRY83_02980, partial [Flavobacteriales bacterium]|nr:hypothetical protein [Flavobacteriales bacterium]